MIMGSRKAKLIVWIFSILFVASFSAGFNPVDNYLIDCGASTNSYIGNRVFVADNLASNFLSTSQDILAKTTLKSFPSSGHSVLLQTARVFTESSEYTFLIKRSGRHWIHLYFYPFSYNSYDMSSANFAVSTPDHVLLSNFSVQNTSIVKEFSVNVTSSNLVITFTPSSNSIAFLNAIEVVSVPNGLILDAATGIDQVANYVDLSPMALETVWRVNMGGPSVTTDNDSLWRTWIPDQRFLEPANSIGYYSNIASVTYVDGGATEDSAPNTVYGTATGINMTDPSTNFNVTWEFNVDPEFQYLIRFHICDIVSSSLNQLYFNAYVDYLLVRTLDPSSDQANTLGVACYIDFVKASTIANKLRISVGPHVVQGTLPGAILNGLEIMKMNNSMGSLSSAAVTVSPGLSSKKNIGLIVGEIIGPVAAAILAGMLCLWCRNRRRLLHGDSTTCTPLSINGGNPPFMRSKNLDSIYRYRIPFAAAQECTNNFDDSWIIKIDGFVKLYKGVLNGMKVAVKRKIPGPNRQLQSFKLSL